LKKKSILIILILLIATCIRLLNINWGLPNNIHIYPYNYDEKTYLGELNNLNLEDLDFNPDDYWKVHFPVYFTGFSLALGKLLCFYEIGDKQYYKENPIQFSLVIKWLRLCWGLFPMLLLIIVSFYIGKELVDDKLGLLFSAITAILPTLLVNSNYAVENILIVLQLSLSFYFSIKYLKTDKLKFILLSAFFVGFASATKQTGILGYIFILVVMYQKWNREKEISHLLKTLFFTVFVTGISFSIFSPYYSIFILKRIFAPSSIAPDIYGSTNIPTDILRIEFTYIIWNFMRIIKVNFIQLAGFLFIFIPFGIYYRIKNKNFTALFFYLITFYLIALFVRYASDSRLTPLAYFIALLGTVGLYDVYLKAIKKFRNLALVLVLSSQVLYVGIIIYYFNTLDNREIASNWIEENILKNNTGVKIGLHEEPWAYAPDIITKEWMHNKYPNSSYYINQYNEILFIPRISEYETKNHITPKMELSLIVDKCKWLEENNPEYVILMHETEEYCDYFNKSVKYEFLKGFRKKSLLGLNNLAFYDHNCEIYQRVAK